MGGLFKCHSNINTNNNFENHQIPLISLETSPKVKENEKKMSF